MGILLVLFVAVGVIAAFGHGGQFIQLSNLQNLAQQVGMLGIFSVGECLVIITAGIDLSVGSLIGLSGVVCAMALVNMHFPLWAALLLTMGLGIVVGSAHSFLIGVFRIPSFIITLGSLDVLRSAAQLLAPTPVLIQDLPRASAILTLGNERLFGVPYSLWILIIITIVAELFMRRTAAGRHIYALGGNEEATRLSGIRPTLVLWLVYCVSALLSCVAGIVYVGYSNQADNRLGSAYELNAIAAAVIGGCSLFGGEGSVIGAVVGAALLEVLLNGISLCIETNASLWQGMIVGCVVVLAVLMNELRARARGVGFGTMIARMFNRG